MQKEHWSDGAIAVRLACVDDVWLTAGQLYLYDIARLSDTAVDGPGAVHPVVVLKITLIVYQDFV